MTILLATHNYYPYKIGGTEVYVANFASYLTNAGHQVRIIASVDNEAFEKNHILYDDDYLRICSYDHDRIQIFGVQYKNLDTKQIYSRESIRHEASWSKFITSETFGKLDVLHINGFTPTIGLDLIYSLKKYYHGLKVVSSYHTAISCAKENLLFANTLSEQHTHVDHVADMISYRLNIPIGLAKLVRWLSIDINIPFLPAIFSIKYLTKSIIRSFEKLDKVTDEWWIYSEGIKQHLIERGIKPNKLVFERHGIAAIFIGNQRKATPPYKFLFSGRLIKQKGFITLLTAWRNLDPSDDKALWITGTPTSKDPAIQKIIVNSTTRKDIKWLGELDQKKLAEVYTQVNTVIIPSEVYEIGPLVFHEAIASGCQVIASDIGGCKELAEFYEEHAITFKTGDANDLKKKILARVGKPNVFNPELNVSNFTVHFKRIVKKSKIYSEENDSDSSI